MQVIPYIFFNGNCREALDFYATVLNGKIETIMTHGESPASGNVDESWQSKILHARLTVGDRAILASDSPPQFGKVTPSGFYVTLEIATPEEADRVFNTLAEGGTVRMPIGQTFWARRFAMLVDRFDIPWMISCK
jgi:PhnB protein